MSSAVLSRCKVSSEQLDILLSFMEDHPDFAAGKSVYSRFSSSKLWRLLAERLNAAADAGGARKSADKWCRYWADIKYKTRRKTAAGGALGDLSSAEERLQNILGKPELSAGGVGGARGSQSDADEERKPALDDDMFSDGSAGDGARLSTEELLAEAAMRSALAAEKQAEAASQAVELLRELLAVVRERAPFAPHAHPHQHAAPHPAQQHVAPHSASHAAPAPQDHLMQHHHHRL